MFAKLTGIIDTIGQGHLILDVGGVGYLVFVSNRTLNRLGEKGSSASLFIETNVREDHIHLFGFCDTSEREWFKRLTGVQGVGAKVGLALLSVCPPESLASIIASGDKAALGQAEGVGPKLAARLITELKDKIGDISFATHDPISKETKQEIPANQDNQALEDALSALANLGYGRAEAYTVLAKVKDQADDAGALIALALKQLA